MLLFPILQRGIPEGKSPQSTPVRGFLKGKIDQFLVSFDSKIVRSAPNPCYKIWHMLQHFARSFRTILQSKFVSKRLLPCKRVNFSCFAATKQHEYCTFQGYLASVLLREGSISFKFLVLLTSENSPQQMLFQFFQSLSVHSIEQRHRHIQVTVVQRLTGFKTSQN